ncbi:hypothetical protein JW707_04535 [Candidatus Woesearchaeota archaeon]|nr:hypothetical protein [Candidatus Woesearchaeota archaeon]
MTGYFIGFDIGSDSVHAVVLDSEGKIAYSPESAMHFGNPVETLKDVYEEIIEKFGFEKIKTASFTGSVGEFIAEKINMPFFHDTITIPIGAGMLAPEADYIFHIGAKDPYFFEREKIKTDDGWRSFVPDHGTGTKCGGGSGILITKQCRRYFENEFKAQFGEDRKGNRIIMQENLNKMFRRAEEEISKADKSLDVGGRCGVVIQSDMIHLQNSGEQIKNILKGMFERVAKNYKSDVLRTRKLDKGKKAVATGGVFGNRHIVRTLGKTIELKVPENYKKAGAVGAALKAKGISKKFMPEELGRLAEAEKEKIKTAPPLSSALGKVRIYEEEKRIAKEEDLVIYSIDQNKKTEALLGIDGGSTTTKAIIADADSLRIVAEICLYTNGKPLQTAQEMFRQIRKYIGDKISIKGVAYTGSSGSFYYKLFTDLNKNREKNAADIVKDEITCHAFGVKHYKSNVDTIFELGGQDAKFTLFNKDGTVKKAKMNLSCMAGTGQTMHNMVEMLGLDIKTTFHDYALKAEKTPIVDETCGVFTESGIAGLIAMGFPKEEVAAAIAYGFMGGYVNKFVGNEKFGEYASAQGGPFNGKSCLAALALHTGMEIHAFPHRQLFGALGAVIAISKEIKRMRQEGVEFESKFRGLDLADMKFEKNVENCSRIVSDSCGVRDCQLQVYKIGNDLIYSGGLCPKGNTDTSSRRAPDYVATYKRILEKHVKKYSSDLGSETEKERVLIPRSLTFLNEKGVFYAAFYHALGFDVCISPESDDSIANMGIKYSHSETCYPVKLAHGHAAFLKKHLRKGKDKILLVNTIGAGREKYRFCPYVGGAGFIVKDALHIRNRDVLLPVIYFNDPDYSIEECFYKDMERVFKGRFSKADARNAVKKAEDAEKQFLEEVYTTGQKIISALKERGNKVFIGIGRGYTILDDKASSKVHELFSSYGLHFVPAFFLKLPYYDIREIADNMYWYQGQSMIKYNLMTAIDPLLYGVRETNFNCGTDSFLIYHEEEIMNKAEKPHLVLQTDGHNSNAQFGTRTLANFEVVKRHKPKQVRIDIFKKKMILPEMKNKLIGIPYMGDNSYTAAAAFRAVGFNAEVMPTHTKEAQQLARKFASTNTCRPFAFQIGDQLAWLFSLKERGIDPNKEAAVFHPTTRGPCRLGQYPVMLRKFFDEVGFDNVSVISPDAEQDYNNVPIPKMVLVKLSSLFYKGVYCQDVLYDALLRTRPYEKVKGEAEKAYLYLRNKLCRLIEERASITALVSFMRDAKDRFEAVLDKDKKRKPLVAMNGEIFVRSHPEANQDSIKLLEKYGLEVVLGSITQWTSYINRLNIRKHLDSKNWKGVFSGLLKKGFIKNVEMRIYSPFAKYLEGRKPHDPEYVIESAQKALIYERRIGGEAPLSIGEAHLFSKGDLENLSGIYHVGPFGCMQETVATSKIHSIIHKRRAKAKEMHEKIVPFMDGVFGDSELPNLEAEIAAFAEKCYLKRELTRQKQAA